MTLAKAGREGRDAIRAALKELEVAGYLERTKIQDDRGRWRSACRVLEIPLGQDSEDPAPTPENPTPEIPDAGEAGANRKTDEKETSTRDQEIDALADSWWREYKSRTGKAPIGKKAWFALRNLIRGALSAGWTTDEISRAMSKCETIPSMPYLERVLQTIPRTKVSTPVDPMPQVNCETCNGHGLGSERDEEGYSRAFYCSCDAGVWLKKAHGR